jgi:aspartate racemase
VKRIGLIGGMSWESTAVYYRLLNEGVRDRLGGLHSADLVLRSFDFADVEALQIADDWDGAGAALTTAARDLAAAGADCVLICTNTMHKVADRVQSAVGIPLLHIADATARAAKARQLQRPLLLATRYTMEQAFYRDCLSDQHGIDVVVPDDAERGVVHDVIFDELCRGVIREDSRRRYLDIIANAQARHGIDSVILGCTEIGLLIGQPDTELPVLDTTPIHVEAALDFAFA